ncbi:unnamed protein product, partial [Pylaiella littoralis]
MTGSLESLSCAVRNAQVALNTHHENGALQEEKNILGEGGFGIVQGASHSVLPGSFALKRLKKNAGGAAIYCATVEMIVMARLAKAPHPHVMGAIAIDDRE